MKMTKPMMKPLFSSESRKAGMMAPSEASCGLVGCSLSTAVVRASSSSPGLLEHPRLERHLGRVVGLGDGLLAVEVGLQRVVVHLVERGGHDEEAEDERQAGDDLVGRRGLQPERLTGEAEDDDDAGEAGEQDQQRRRDGQQGEADDDEDARRRLAQAVAQVDVDRGPGGQETRS